MTLTNKQKRFVDEYMIDLNATQAAIRAGYSEKTAYSQGSENLRKPEVQEAIQKAQNKLADKHEITKDKIINELAKIAFSDPRKVATWNADTITLIESEFLEDDAASIISEITQTKDGVKVKTHDKRAALMDIAKMMGFVTDKQEITGADGGAIQIERIELIAPTINQD